MNRGPRGSKHGWFRGKAAGRIVTTLRYKGRWTRAGGVRNRSRESSRKNIIAFMVYQGIHIIITYGTRGRHVDGSVLLYMHPIIIWSVCTFFLSTHRTINAGNYFSKLPQLQLAALATRDYILPHKNCTVDQCASYHSITQYIVL